MEDNRKRMKFEILTERYFTNFWSILLCNLIFFVPLLFALAIMFLLQSFVQGALYTVLSSLLVIAVFPFYSGLVLVCRNLARGDDDVKVFSTFVKGVKDNFKKFTLYGAITCVVFLVCYFSISVYAKLLSLSWIFYALLFVSIIIALAVLFIFFYVPVMTVTFDLSLKNIVKNSFLMSFGEIKNNFFALIALAVVLAIAFTVLAFSTDVVVLIIMTLILLSTFVPATCQFVVTFFIYDDMYASIAKRDDKSKMLDKAIAEAKAEAQGKTIYEDYSDVDISSLKDTDDYIFYKGKMVKQSVLLKRALEQRQQESLENKEV
ncbi:MAG: DUF624 domain-containing protein [Ruminococcus sp.]|nr:DUF624 domain-containing protein [Ruminococcus sp.]